METKIDEINTGIYRLSTFIATALLVWPGDPWAVSVYLMCMALITIVTAYVATETFRDEIV